MAENHHSCLTTRHLLLNSFLYPSYLVFVTQSTLPCFSYIWYQATIDRLAHWKWCKPMAGECRLSVHPSSHQQVWVLPVVYNVVYPPHAPRFKCPPPLLSATFMILFQVHTSLSPNSLEWLPRPGFINHQCAVSHSLSEEAISSLIVKMQWISD